MKTDITDPWSGVDVSEISDKNCISRFEDSFVEYQSEHSKLADSEEYLEKLYTRLRSLQKGTSKKDLVASLAEVKEDCIARLITSGCKLETEEETELASNPLIRHIAPHLQALTATELVCLLKADVLQVVTEAEQDKEIIEKSTN
ncbi:PREDICTED: uncharacterized protein LOC107188424 [Dufourea novaeangliae]|uniref:Uncharacterized protein n=1 Tax=Dufourea novaeangliae TaxID=178035 RepID=A0A154PEP0_DUFNO|nr:PREDICTED: uncharacterized protein LOC107188424 [Dufourea novaeangliae]KZC10336.1 hypothetical protein WN55_01452 [Dufourea novaeangliae]